MNHTVQILKKLPWKGGGYGLQPYLESGRRLAQASNLSQYTIVVHHGTSMAQALLG